MIRHFKNDDEEWLIACGTCVLNGKGKCPGHRKCLIRGQPDKKLLDEGYEFDMNFEYRLWKTIYPKPEIVELDSELFEI